MDSRIRSLWKRVEKADRDAACELLQLYYPAVFAYLRRLCGSREEAEDLTQQTFLKVWSARHGFAGRSTFSTWLHRIAYNTYVDWQREKAFDVRRCPEPWWLERPQELPVPCADVADRQLAQRLYEAVDQLGDDKRHVVHLHYYQGLSLRETAQVLEIATSTVKYRLREVLKVLRKKMKAQEITSA